MPDATPTSPRSRHRPIGVRLNDVLTPLLPATSEVVATTCTDRPELVRKGDVFFAQETDMVSLLPRVKHAVALGAAAVVTSEWLPISGTPQFVVADPSQAYGEFCQAVVGNPASELPLTVVTGGFGKSTVARLLHSIGRAARLRVGCVEGRESHDGLQASPWSEQATPVAAAKWLALSVANGCDHTVAEASLSDARWLDGAPVHTVCLTNAVDAQQTPVPGALAHAEMLVFNARDAACRRYASARRGDTVAFDLAKEGAKSSKPDIRGRVLERHTSGQLLLVEHQSKAVVVDLPGVGDAFAENCLAAIATAIAWGVDLQAAAAGIEGSGVPRWMMRPIVCGQEFPVFLDAAQSPAAIREATRSVEAIANGRVLTVLGAASQAAGRESTIAAACEVSDLVVVPGRESRSNLGDQVRCVDDLFAAVALVLALAEAGDAVLVLEPNRHTETSAGDNPLEAMVRDLLSLRLENEHPPAARTFAASSNQRMKPEDPC